MKPWPGRRSRSIFCALRSLTLIPRPTEEHLTTARGRHFLKTAHDPLVPSSAHPFSTTPAPQRSKREQRIREEKKKQQRDDAPRNEKRVGEPGFRPKAPMTARQGIAAARDFDRLVEITLQDVYHKLHEKGQPLARWKNFERRILNACRTEDLKTSAKGGPLGQVKVALQKAYLSSGVPGLSEELEYILYADDLTAKYSTENLEAQKKVADLRYPAEWYPGARSIQRTIHLHVGPTNSGKTYHALKRLEQCKSGFYAGPLRLLAQEVYHRFKESGVACSLVTGDDVKTPENGEIPRIVSNTVEMINLGRDFDVGVIDEIQMIANPARGWAWTRALLGSRASELHLCGETRVVPLIRELCALTGDILEIHRYERLNPLKVMPHSLRGNLNKLEKGDCLVSFSTVGIHALKADIEKTTGRRAAIVYGGLPAEIRTQQASLFNDPDNDYDFLVASDAIGMGLNLSCKRIIFETLIKRLPTGLQRLTVPEIKQIGGRAGRYRPANSKGSDEDGSVVGLVTSLEQIDLPFIKEALDTEPPPLRAAGIIPPDFTFQKFAPYFPRSVSFEYLVKRLIEIADLHPLFFMCNADGQLTNSEIIDTVNGLRLQDQLVLMAAPMITRDQSQRDVTRAFAHCIAENSRGRLVDIPHLNLEILEQPVSGSKDYMYQLESLHRAIILYLWLSFRFGGVFTDRTLAAHVKKLVEERLVRALTEFSANKKLRKDASLRRQIALQKQMLHQQRINFDPNAENPNARAEEIEENSDTESTPDRSAETSNAAPDIDLMGEENVLEADTSEETSSESQEAASRPS